MHLYPPITRKRRQSKIYINQSINQKYLNQKVAALPLFAYKTAAAAATLEKYLAKKRWHSNTVPNGEISTLFTKVAIQAFEVLVQVTIGISWLKW